MSDTNDLDAWIGVEYRGRIAIIEINRPEKLNALPKDGFYLLAQRLREVDTRDEVAITVLTGRGRFFSAYVTTSTKLLITTKLMIFSEAPMSQSAVRHPLVQISGAMVLERLLRTTSTSHRPSTRIRRFL